MDIVLLFYLANFKERHNKLRTTNSMQTPRTPETMYSCAWRSNSRPWNLNNSAVSDHLLLEYTFTLQATGLQRNIKHIKGILFHIFYWNSNKDIKVWYGKITCNNSWICYLFMMCHRSLISINTWDCPDKQ